MTIGIVHPAGGSQFECLPKSQSFSELPATAL
jgi:hypothetical protein